MKYIRKHKGISEAFRMPEKNDGAIPDKGDDETIKKIVDPYLAAEIKNSVCRIIAGWDFPDKSVMSLKYSYNDPAMSVRILAVDDKDGIGLSPSVSVSLRDGVPEITVKFMLMPSPDCPEYIIKLDPRVLGFKSLLETLEDKISKEFRTPCRVKCRQVECRSAMHILEDKPHICVLSCDPDDFERLTWSAKFPCDPRYGSASRSWISAVGLAGGLSVYDFKNFVTKYVEDVNENEAEIIPDWLEDPKMDKVSKAFGCDGYDIARDLCRMSGITSECPLKFKGVRFMRCSGVGISRKGNRDLHGINNLDWVADVCGTADPYFKFTELCCYPVDRGKNPHTYDRGPCFYTIWTGGKFTQDMLLGDDTHNGYDDVIYYPETGKLEIIHPTIINNR